MKTSIANLAKELARLSEAEISELTGILLNEHDISATIYHFGVVPIARGVHEEFDVKLVSAPRHSLLRAVKLTKEMLGLGLKDAKTIVDSRPCMLKEFATWEEAEELLKEFEEIGCEIEITPVG